jgi:hypothetical protein
METCKIFIASSAELKHDREEFRKLLSLINDRLHYRGLYLKLEEWEYFFDAISQDSKQGDYNESIKECEIVICLFYTKAGKYTQVEFDTALQQFHKTGKPLIYTYFKEPEKNENAGTAVVPDPSLKEFKDRLSSLGHFYTRYKSTEDLHLQFKMQLDLLADKGFIKLQEEVIKNTEDAVKRYITVQGNNNMVNTGSGTINSSTMNIGNQQAEKIMNVQNNSGGINF